MAETLTLERLKMLKRFGLINLKIDPQKKGGEIVEIWVWKDKDVGPDAWREQTKALKEIGFKCGYVCKFNRKTRKFIPV